MVLYCGGDVQTFIQGGGGQGGIYFTLPEFHFLPSLPSLPSLELANTA